MKSGLSELRKNGRQNQKITERLKPYLKKQEQKNHNWKHPTNNGDQTRGNHTKWNQCIK